METGSAMEECKKACTLTQTNIIEKGTFHLKNSNPLIDFLEIAQKTK